MELSEAVRRRRMVRRFDPGRPVSEKAVERMLEHAVRAPSAGFTQGWAFLVLATPEEREAFWAATVEDLESADGWLRGMRTAPLLVLPMASKAAYLDRYAESDKGWADRDEDRWPVPYWDVDAGMASLLILLTAVDEGLGACFFGVPARRWPALRERFEVPETFHPVGVIAVGHPPVDGSRGAKGSPSRRTRKGLDEVVHRGRWGGYYGDSRE